MAQLEQEFETLIEKYTRLVSHAIQKVCFPKYRECEEDIRQEVHLKIWGLLKSGKKMDSPESYIYRVAFTTALRFVQTRGGGGSTEYLSDPPKSSEGEIKSNQKMIINDLLKQLDDEHRRALKAYLVGFNHKEVATLFGWTESKARHLVYRGINALKALQNKSGEGKNER